MGKRYKWESWTNFLNLRDFIVVDVETTGFSTQKERIIEIALLKISSGNIVDEFSTFINPGKKIPTRITKLTGITQQDVNTAPTFEDIAKQILSFIEDFVIVAHNATFDVGFLESEFCRCNIEVEFEFFCTLKLARRAFPELKSHRLEALVQHINLMPKQSHRALDDAKSAYQLFQYVHNLYNRPLARAIHTCCSPMIDYYVKDVGSRPLEGKRLSLVGEFTFSYNSAHTLITTAGGTVHPEITGESDYLVYGYTEEALNVPIQHASLMNEVHLLKICGAVLFLGVNDKEDSYEVDY